MDRQKQVCRPHAVLEPIQIRSGRGDRLAFEETRRFNLEAWRRRFPDLWNGHSRGTETEGETEGRAATNWSAGMDGVSEVIAAVNRELKKPVTKLRAEEIARFYGSLNKYKHSMFRAIPIEDGWSVEQEFRRFINV